MIFTADNFEKEVLKSEIPVVVDFYADWCGPCKMMAPEFKKAAQAMEPAVRFAKLDTEALPAVAQQWAIRSIPTLILFTGGQEINRISGACRADELIAWLQPQLA